MNFSNETIVESVKSVELCLNAKPRFLKPRRRFVRPHEDLIKVVGCSENYKRLGEVYETGAIRPELHGSRV